MKDNPNALWDSCLQLIKNNVSEQQYNTWFKPIAFESYNEDKNTVLVRIPSPYIYEYLEENYVDLLSKVLSRTFGKGVFLNYRVLTDKEHNLTQDIQAEPVANIGTARKRERVNESPSVLDAAQPQQIDSQLNPHLTFSNFIEGDSNKLPRSVGLSIAEHPNKTTFNPMFIFGPSG